MTRRPSDARVVADPRVPCPLQGGASIDLERCVACAYFKGAMRCVPDHRELVYADPKWWLLLVR
jgi:hypothetical protein